LGTTFAAILVTSDIPSTLLTAVSRKLPTYPVGLSSQILAVVLTRPAPLLLLAMSIFYIWVYVRQAFIPPTAIGISAS
jgi:hypothetical protein